MDNTFFVGLIVWYVIFLFSTTLHEASHSYAAFLAGDDTAYRAGSATLNPIPHMMREKLGMILVPLVSYFLNGGSWIFGWASAPFNPYWAARHPRRSLFMSLAGPISHLAPMAVAWTAMLIGLRTGYFSFATAESGMQFIPVAGVEGNSFSWSLAMFLNVLLRLNAVLLTLNLMPLPPFDGSEIWYILIKKEESRLRWRHFAASYAFAGMILAWRYFPPFYRFVYFSLVKWLFYFS